MTKIPISPAAEDRARVQPLVCTSCGAPVPLGEGDLARCPSCGHEVPIPAPYAELRAAQRERRKDVAETERLYRTLTGPPGLLVTVWLSAGGIWSAGVALVVVAGLLFAVVVVGAAFLKDFTLGLDGAIVAAVVIGLMYIPIAWEWFLHRLAPLLGADPVDMLHGATAHALLGVVLLLLMAVPLLLLSVCDDYRKIRARLQAALAATPPATAGGAATCRQCGAALEVAAGSLGTRCVYCDTDNLLAVSSAESGAARSEADQLHRHIGGARAEELRVRAQAWTDAGGMLAVCAMAIPFLWGFGALAQWLVDDGPRPPSWHASITTPRQLIPRDAGHAPVPSGTDAAVTFTAADYRSSSYTAYYFLPLRAGETAALEQVAPGLGAHWQQRTLSAAPAIEWTWQDSDDATITAPFAGWYRLRVRVSGGDPGRRGNVPTGPFPVRWTVAPRPAPARTAPAR